MAAPAESLLQRTGMVRSEQLAEAHRLRARGGGTVGEWLVRLGAVSEQQLLEFYHRGLRVPRVTAAQLGQVPAEVLATVPGEMATEFRVVPVSIDANGVLTIAMADPSDTHVSEEVAFYAGHFCRRAVAAISDIVHAIDRHYRRPATSTGVAPGASAHAVANHDIAGDRAGDAAADAVAAAAALVGVRATPPLPQPPLAPGLPDPPGGEILLLTRVKEPGRTMVPPLEALLAPTWQDEPPPRPGPQRPSRSTRPITREHGAFAATELVPAAALAAGGAAMDPSPPAAALPDAAAALPDATAAAALDASGAIDPEAPILLTNAISGPPRRRRHRTLPGVPIVPDVPVAELRAARNREEVAATLLGYACQFAPVAALLVMRKGTLTGHEARGVPDPAILKAVLIPVEEPSVVRDVVQSRLPYRAPLPDVALPRSLRDLAGGQPGDLLLVPISVGDRAIAILFAAGLLLPLPEAALDDLAREAGTAYERLILANRR